MDIASAVQIITPGVDVIDSLSFTSDGNYLNYVSSGANDVEGKMYQIPVLGGTPRLLLDPADTHVTYSPDGRQMAYAMFDIPSNEGRLMLASADGSETKVLAVRKVSGTSGGGDSWGAYVDVEWSPDGQRIAALVNDRDPGGQNSRIVEIDVATGAQKPVPGGRAWRSLTDFRWLPDGSGYVLAGQPKTGTPRQIWIVSYPAGSVRRVSNDLNGYYAISLSADGRTIVAVQVDEASDVWEGPASAPDNARQISAGRLDGIVGIAWTLDNRIVYTALNSERWELLLADADGANARQLIFDGRYRRQPTVCDHGRAVVYTSDSDGADHLWKLDLHSGVSTKLTNGPSEQQAACDADGEWVFYLGQTPTVHRISSKFRFPAARLCKFRIELQWRDR